MEEKQKYSRAANESEGYGNDVIVSEKQVLDWSYRLTLRVFPEERRRLHLWPGNPSDFGYLAAIDFFPFSVDMHYKNVLSIKNRSYLRRF